MISGSARGPWTYSTKPVATQYNVLNDNYPILSYLVTRKESWTYDGRNIYKGSSKIKSIKYGSEDIKNVYVGDTCIYEYNTGTQTIQGSSYIVSHLFMENNNTPHLSMVITSLTSAILFTSKMMIYEGFYIKPLLYQNGSAVNTTSSNFTVDVWIKGIKMSRLNYPEAYVYYYGEPENIVGVYLRPGSSQCPLYYWAGDHVDDYTTYLEEGFLLFFNVSQFSHIDSISSSSPGGSPSPYSFYTIQVSNTLDSLVVVGNEEL